MKRLLGEAASPNQVIAPEITTRFFELPLREAREAFERIYFEQLLGREQSNMSKVAERAGLERTHLYRKLKQLNIRFSRRTDDSSAACVTARLVAATLTSAAARPAARRMLPLVVGAIGVVYGDIGTSPLYTLRTAFTGQFGLSLSHGERARHPVGDRVGADDRRDAEVHHADHARRQPRRGRHTGAYGARVARHRRSRAAALVAASASASSARRCSTATA